MLADDAGGVVEVVLDPNLRGLVDGELALAAQVQAALRGAGQVASARAPYFAHLEVSLGGRPRTLLVGEHSHLDLGDAVPAILGWQQAPLARVLFCAGEGESFEEEINERPVVGQVHARRLLGFADGALRWIRDGARELRRGDDGVWREQPAERGPLLLPSARVHGGFADRAALDAEQRAVLARSLATPVLVVGAAGSGKTTVALHRLRAVVDAAAGARCAALVLVPEPGLAALVQARLKVLGLPQVPVRTYDAWVRREHRRLWPAHPGPVLDDAPVPVLRLKRHPALLSVVAELVREQWQALWQQVGREFDDAALAAQPWPGAGSPLDAIDAAERTWRERYPARRDALHAALGPLRARWLDVHADLPLLLGERDRLARVRARAGDSLRQGDVDATLLRTRRQLDPAAAEAYAHVDPARRRGVDGRALDATTPEAVAGSLDVEDLPLLLELLWLKTGACRTRDGDLGRLDHIVVDEVQDVAAVELRSLVRALAPGGALTAAGDDAQQLDPSAAPADWPVVLATLGAGDEARVALRHSHRCPAPVQAFAAALRPASGSAVVTTEPGPEVRVSRGLSPGLAALLLRDALDQLLAQAGAGEVAVICRDAARARALHAVLADALPARLVLDGQFDFRPGLVVTEVQAVRGLEFDHVVLPDVTAERYPATAEARAALHLAASRARWQLWLLCPGEPSPLLETPGGGLRDAGDGA